MGDVRTQLTPETPGRAAILNPFESPSDYCSLHEPFVSSPSVFKPSKSAATPQQFRWSIDQLAAINPIEIDAEDIHRQALYLSRAKTDKETEERRQKAIEEFFTKRTIVPSPWTQHEGKPAAPFHSTKCADLIHESPVGRVQAVQSGKSTVGCQTHLSLPVDFNLEKVLGEYFRAEETADQSQDNLSSSSLRRKLFLDGHASGSECSSPSSPPQEGPYYDPPAALGVLCSIDLSPVRCRSPTQTPSSGQFSSSPIQGGRRAFSLGSITSPTFLEKSPASVTSPSFSPIAINLGKTPDAEQKRLIFPSPETLSASTSMVNAFTRNPYIEGCSPIKSIFQIKSRSCRGNAPHRTSLFQIPFALEPHSDDKENSPPSSIKSPEGDLSSLFHQLENIVPDGHVMMGGEPIVSPTVYMQQEYLQSEELKENDTVEMVEPVEIEEEHSWPKETVATDNIPMASFMTGITFSGESSHMCMSPLAESSVIPCENSSIQVDSGYNTQTYGSCIMDGIGAETTYKENDTHISDIQNKCQHFKDISSVDCKNQLLEPESPEFQHSTQKSQNKLARYSLNSGMWKLTGDGAINRLNKNGGVQSPPRTLNPKSLSHFLQ
ncbi:protein aurora borealis isoform X2 [Xenopus laevis]|uniref:Protein aurora borealis n=1 Tax=Xenopus laevis TaxID=8355 RepID=A0A8J1MBK6_XENLA|nr:protein aurora borealis isoform X2 [Xenopus laevis]